MAVKNWLNIEWADGTESTAAEDPGFARLQNALRAAGEKCSRTGCTVNAMRGGEVYATFRATGPVDLATGLVPFVRL
jgi:hypothetical protein